MELGQMYGILLWWFVAVSDKQRFELYVIGAHNRHGQNYTNRILFHTHKNLTGSIDGYDTDGGIVHGNKFETEGGRFYNQNVVGQLPTHHIQVNNIGICMV